MLLIFYSFTQTRTRKNLSRKPIQNGQKLDLVMMLDVYAIFKIFQLFAQPNLYNIHDRNLEAFIEK